MTMNLLIFLGGSWIVVLGVMGTVTVVMTKICNC